VKIVAKDAEEVLIDVVLGDDEEAGDFIIDPPPLPSEHRKAQITPLFRGTNPFTWGRGNRSISFRWTVSRNHASADAAGTFLRGHAATVPINVTLVVTDGIGTDTYMGVMTEVTAVGRLGRETVFAYAIDGAVLQEQETEMG
jgi:hypothetical protein